MKPNKVSYFIVNSLTLYRLLSAPFLVLIILEGRLILFKWLIAFSFLTDAIDGPLARKYKVTSIFGSMLDSIADDVTILVSIFALWVVHPNFLQQRWIIISGLLLLFTIQTIAALIVYKKVTSFHTYLAKTAAILQAIFFLLMFFEWQHVEIIFYSAAFVTALELIEEIALVIILPNWKADVKGLYWVLRTNNRSIK